MSSGTAATETDVVPSAFAKSIVSSDDSPNSVLSPASFGSTDTEVGSVNILDQAVAPAFVVMLRVLESSQFANAFS